MFEATIQHDRLFIEDVPIHLTGKEFLLVKELARTEAYRSKGNLMTALYGGLDEPEIKIIDVFVCKARAKIQRHIEELGLLGATNPIETVWGKGYRWDRVNWKMKFKDSGDGTLVSVPQTLAEQIIDLMGERDLETAVREIIELGIPAFEDRVLAD